MISGRIQILQNFSSLGSCASQFAMSCVILCLKNAQDSPSSAKTMLSQWCVVVVVSDSSKDDLFLVKIQFHFSLNMIPFSVHNYQSLDPLFYMGILLRHSLYRSSFIHSKNQKLHVRMDIFH